MHITLEETPSGGFSVDCTATSESVTDGIGFTVHGTFDNGEAQFWNGPWGFTGICAIKPHDGLPALSHKLVNTESGRFDQYTWEKGEQMEDADGDDIAEGIMLAILKLLLVDRDRLNEHITQLQKRPEIADTGLPSDELLDKVLQRNFWRPTGDLVALLLNPVALFVLHTEINESLPNEWLEDLAASGKRLMDAHDIKLDRP